MGASRLHFCTVPWINHITSDAWLADISTVQTMGAQQSLRNLKCLCLRLHREQGRLLSWQNAGHQAREPEFDPYNHMVKGKNQLCRAPLWLPHVPCHTWATPPQNNTRQKEREKKIEHIIKSDNFWMVIPTWGFFEIVLSFNLPIIKIIANQKNTSLYILTYFYRSYENHKYIRKKLASTEIT